MSNKLHIALRCGDLGQSIQFYEQLFELAPDKRTDSYARFQTSNPGLVLSLNAASKVGRDSRVEHFGIRMDSEAFAHARERLRAAGMVRKEQTKTRCCHAIQDKLWVRDPDGNDWEFYELLEDLEPTKPSGCC